MSDTENEDTPEWQDEDVLEGHVDEGLTYDEIAERYEDATPYQVGKFVRRYDITPVHNRPKYQDGEVPVRLIDGMNVEHPIPVDVAEKYGIDDGTPLRYIADPDVMDLSVIIETGDHVTGDLSNERRATKRGTTYPTARYPMTLGHAFGLVDQFSTADAGDDVSPDEAGGFEEDAEFSGGIFGGDSTDEAGGDGVEWGESDDSDQDGQSEVTAEFEEIDDTRFRVRFSPSPTVWTPSGVAKAPSELATISKKLTGLYQGDTDRAGSMPARYQLAVPLEWGEEYGLDDVDTVTQRLGLFEDEDGETHYGVVLVFGEAEGAHPGLQTGVHDSQKGVPGDAEVTVDVIYPVKALLHSVGIAAGTSAKDMNVNLVPGAGWIGLTPK